MSGTVAALDQILGRLETVRSTATEVAKSVQGSVAQIEGTLKGGATKADDFLYQMERLATEGNAMAEQMVGIIHQVQEGMVDPLKAINAFDDALTVVDGKVRTVRDVLADILPTTGEVQAGIREMLRELEASGATIEDVVARLAQQHNSYARELAHMVRLMKEGSITLQEIMRRARELEKILPGSETGALSGLLADLLGDAEDEGRL